VYFQGSDFTTKVDYPALTALYRQYATDLKRYERGEIGAPPPPPVNRAYSNVVGWIAPWTTSDMKSAPVGRSLIGKPNLRALDPSLKPQTIGPAALDYEVDAANPNQVKRIAIDLGSTIPEADGLLTKVNFGTMQLQVAPAGGGPRQTFAELPYAGYNKTAYEASAGVVDFPVSMPVSAIDQHIVVTFKDPTSGATQVGLEEADFSAETDDRGVYVNEPGAPWSPTDPTVTIQVRLRGRKPPVGTKLQIGQYAPNNPGFNEFSWALVSASQPNAQAPYVTMAAGAAVVDGAYVTVPVPNVNDGLPYSTVTMKVSALRSGPSVLQFFPHASADPITPPPPTVDDFGQTFFGNVRVLPFHNAMTIAFENWLRVGPSVDLVTQRVFDAVFRTFFLMYPAMRFLRDPLQFQAWRGRICEVTDPALFETARYMPVTRSLTAGQRQMLELWSTYVDGNKPVTPPHSGAVLRRA
jgi:hypothetical protein